MRLENCFAQMRHHAVHPSIWDSQASLLIFIEVLNTVERYDVRNEVNKELEKNIASLSSLLDAPIVNGTKLQQTLDSLYSQLYGMQNISLQAIKNLRENDLLNSIRQRSSAATNINSFEIPPFYSWLKQPAGARQQQLLTWIKEFSPIEEGINLLLNLLRESAEFYDQTAAAGFFQKSLNTQQTCQIVRVGLPAEATYFPDASGSKHRISVRFLQYEGTNQRPSQVAGDINFALSCCGL